MIKRKENSQVVSLFEYSTMTESEKEFERVRLASDIEIDKAFKEYAMVSGLEGIEAVYTEAESGGKSDSAFVKVIDTIVDKLKQIYDAFVNFIGNLFKSDSDGLDTKTVNEILSTSTQQVRFNSDVRKIRRECEQEIEEGSKLIQAISEATGAEPSKIRKFCDKAGNFARIAVPTVLTLGVSYGIKKSLDMKKGKDDTYERIEKAAQKCRKIQDKEKRAQATNVLKAMKKSYSECLQQETSFFKQLKISFDTEKRLRGINKNLRQAEITTDLFTTKKEKREAKKLEKKIQKEDKAYDRKLEKSEAKKDVIRDRREESLRNAEDVFKNIAGTK